MAKIYAPHIYRFAYRLRDKNGSYDWLEKNGNKIRNHFPHLQGKDFTLRSPVNAPKKFDFSCLADGKTSRVYKAVEQSPQRLNLSPKIIHDCEALELISRIYQQEDQDALDMADLGAVLNPRNCFDLSQPNDSNFMGQTLLITAFLDPKNSNPLTAIATEILANILHTDSADLFDFYREDTLLGSPLFEFGNPYFDPLNDHLLILFFADEASSQQFVEFLYPKLCRLLCFYHKILYAFNNGNQDYYAAKTIRDNIDTTLGNLLQLEDTHNVPNKVLSVSETQAYKQHLKNLLRDSIEYSHLSRRVEHSLNTLALNRVNYQTTLRQLQVASGDPLSFLQLFLDVELTTFHNQLQGHVAYLELGSKLLSQAASTIQGLVAIDEAERDRHLQNSIGYVGAGIGAGSIFAANYAERLEKKGPDRFPIVGEIPILSQADPMIRSFTYSVLVGVVVAFVVWLGLQLLQRSNPKHNNKKRYL